MVLKVPGASFAVDPQRFWMGIYRGWQGQKTFYERFEIWRSHWDWKDFRERHRAERKRITGFAEAEGIVLSERIAAMYYKSGSGSDDDGLLSLA